MTILTRNRIIEEGDEYRNNGAWRPVERKTIGLQVLFTPYKEVRRAGEEPLKKLTAVPVPDKSHSGQPEKSPPAQEHKAAHYSEAREGADTEQVEPLKSRPDSRGGSHLPTVISRKAHIEDKLAGEKVHRQLTRSKVEAILPGKPPFTDKELKVSAPRGIVIPYTDLSSIPNWIGRNGTFKATAIRFEVLNSGIVQIRPVGKKGLAKNALIEFPVTEIPQIVDWLLRHQKKP